MASDTYEFLQEILKTGEVDRWNYPEYVRDVVVSRNLGSTKIIIAFENDDDFLVWKLYVKNPIPSSLM